MAIRRLRADRKGIYAQPFVFKKRDLSQAIKAEVAEVRQLLCVFRMKRTMDSTDSDKPARYGIDTDDDISERSEDREENYIGTDLYWENRFYNVQPFKDEEPLRNDRQVPKIGEEEEFQNL